MNEQYYKPSGRFSWKGIILMFLTYLVVGTALSWVYLWINRVSPSIYLCLFAAIGFGTAVGVIARLCVKLLKVRNVKAVLIGAVAGLVCMNVIKWAMYVHYDYLTYRLGDDAKTTNAYEYLDFDTFFEVSNPEIKYELLNEYNAYEWLSQYDAIAINRLSEEEIETLKSQSLYQFYGFDKLLGKDYATFSENLEASKSMKAYEYLTEQVDYVPSIVHLVTHPTELWDEIKVINEYGRWSVSSSPSSSSSSYASSSSSGSVVKGGMLWFIWIGELVIITLIAFFIPYGQSKKVFIEMDNNWAKSTDGNRFTFSPLSKSQVKAMLEQSPDNIVNMMMIRPSDIPVGRPYMKMTLDHSEDYTEAYLNVLSMTYNAKNRNYVSSNILTGLRLRPKHTGMLFTMFGMPVPSRVAADGEFYEWDRARNERIQSMTAQQVAPQPSSYVAPNRDVEYDEAAYEAWRAGRLNDQNNNDIDSDIL